MQARKRVKVGIVLDASGSMTESAQSTVSAINEYVNTLANDDGIRAKIAMTVFNNVRLDVHPPVKAKKFEPMVVVHNPPTKPNEYYTQGMTPLYDAIGKAVAMLDAADEDKTAPRTLVILTDGLENCSREFNKAQITAMLKERQEMGWQVVYLGADHDAMVEGMKLGVASHSTMTFDKSKIGDVGKAMSRSTAAYAYAGGGVSGQSVGGFTDEERTSAREGGGNG